MVTRAVRYDAFSASAVGLPSFTFDQAQESMEGAAGFEGADFLEVFTFEMESDGWFGWGAVFPWRAAELSVGSSGGGQVREIGIG